jgi:hypothetical protein
MTTAQLWMWHKSLESFTMAFCTYTYKHEAPKPQKKGIKCLIQHFVLFWRNCYIMIDHQLSVSARTARTNINVD